MENEHSRVEVEVITDTSGAPGYKTEEARLYVMYDTASPADKLYFTEAEWAAFVAGVKDGEFDLDEAGQLPPL
jgi:hypothetical protein